MVVAYKNTEQVKGIATNLILVQDLFGHFSSISRTNHGGAKTNTEIAETFLCKGSNPHKIIIQPWVKVFRIVLEFRILRLTFHIKSASKAEFCR